MRKLLSILLLALLALPFAAPLLAQDGKDCSNMPACCRRKGMHHCDMGSGMKMDMSGMDMAEIQYNADGSISKWPALHATPQRCQYCATSAAATHLDPSALMSAAIALHGLTGLEEVIAQARTTRRIAQQRTRHKRGPPSVSL